MTVTIGLDIGTSGLKAVAVDATGRIVGEAASHYAPSAPEPGWSEQDPEDWWRAAQAVLQELAAQGWRAEAIGLSGQMHGAVFLDGADRPLRPAILWNDGRTARQCALIDELSHGRSVEWTLNPPRTSFTASKILWLRQTVPELFDRLRTVLLPKDHVRLRLTGERWTDVTDASGTNLFDVAQRGWSAPMLAALGLDPGLLPPAVESGEATARLTPAAAAGTGQKAGVPVIGGAADQPAAAVGNGVVRPGTVSITLGTSGVVFAQLDRVAVDPDAAFHTFCHAMPGATQMMAVVLAAGGSVAWCRDILGAPDLTQPEALAGLMAAAGAAPPGAGGLLFLPYLTGERSPHADPEARGAWLGLTRRHEPGHLARAVLEGVSLALAGLVARLERLDVPVREVRVAGGGARGALWLGILASALGRPVLPTTTPDASAFGAALLALAHVTGEPLAAIADRAVLTQAPVPPDPAAREALAAMAPLFEQAYPATASLMHRLGEVERQLAGGHG